MMEKEYHYLISGLPNISPDDNKGWISIPDFRNYLEEHLHPNDFLQVSLIFLKQDHQNIISFFESGKANAENAGNFKTKDFNDPESFLSETDSPFGSVPSYIAEILLKYGNEKGELNTSRISYKLENGFYSYIMENGCPFLKDYFEFEFNLNNLLTFDKAVKQGFDPRKFISGESTHAQHLMNLTGNTIVKDQDFGHFDEIISYTRNSSFSEEERKIDLLRWRIIDEMVIFKNFTIDKVLAYLLQMLIIDRWSLLNKHSGERKLRNILTEFSLEGEKIHEFPNSSGDIFPG